MQNFTHNKFCFSEFRNPYVKHGPGLKYAN